MQTSRLIGSSGMEPRIRRRSERELQNEVQSSCRSVRLSQKAEAKRLGVEIQFHGPTGIDIQAENDILQQVAASGAAGVLFMPFGEGHNETINSVMKAGVPVVTIDGDAPNSNRIAYSGTDWHALGMKAAQQMATALGGKGDVMLSAIIPNDNTRKAREGVEEELKKYPDIKIVGLQNDKADLAEGARLTSAALQANPNIAGFIGLEDASAGVARAVSEAGLAGKVKVTGVNDNPDILEAIRNGSMQATVVQKREAFEVWALRFMYEYKHPSSEYLKHYADLGFPEVPNTAMFGVVVVNKDNIDKLYPEK
jgi:ribose transport system substrate-binding protein